jgi:hypothetical protein
MVRGKGTTAVKEILNPSEVATLRDEQREIASTIREAQEVGGSRGGGIDINKLKNKSKYIDQAIQGHAKDALFKEEQYIADKLSVGMPTNYEMDRPAKNPGAVDKHLNWLKKNDALIQRWAEIQKSKGPNEERRYIDSLRKEK